MGNEQKEGYSGHKVHHMPDHEDNYKTNVTHHNPDKKMDGDPKGILNQPKMGGGEKLPSSKIPMSGHSAHHTAHHPTGHGISHAEHSQPHMKKGGGY